MTQAPSRALVVTTMMLGTISTILAATIVNVAFPALIAEFGVGHDTLQWVAAGFLAATTATMLTTAWLIETFGERATFVGTMSVFLAASLLAATSWSPAALIVARVLQGGAAGILQPLAMVVLFRVFPVEERGRAMALYGFGIVLAPAIGPAIGGALLEAFGWRSIFLLSVPFCIAGFMIRMVRQFRIADRADERMLAQVSNDRARVLDMYWINHHIQFHFVVRTNRGLIWINLFFLLLVSFLPFATDLIGDHKELMLPCEIYGITLLALSATGFVHIAYLSRHPELASKELTPRVTRVMMRRIAFFSLLPLLSMLAALVSTHAAVYVYLLLVVAHFLPGRVDAHGWTGAR